MIIFSILISIFVLTVLTFFIKKKFFIKICPICVGVFTTWFILYIGLLTGMLDMELFQLPVAILMGASVAGIATALEKSLKKENFALIWKSLFIPFGFAFMFSLVSFSWRQVGLFTICLFFIIIFFLKIGNKKIKSKQKSKETMEELKEKLKNCC